MAYRAHTTVVSPEVEAEFHNSAETVMLLLDQIKVAIALDLGSNPADSVTIFINKDTLDGED